MDLENFEPEIFLKKGLKTMKLLQNCHYCGANKGLLRLVIDDVYHIFAVK